MRKVLFALTIMFLTACNSNPKTNDKTGHALVMSADTASTGQSYLDKNQMVDMSGMADTIVADNGVQYVKVDQQKSATYAEVETKQGTAYSRTRSSGRRSDYTGASQGSRTVVQAPVRKKGWSKAAKGTVIGAGTGAVAGAIISKKKGTGAIIGGLLGAGGGYVIGRSMDKKDGRY